MLGNSPTKDPTITFLCDADIRQVFADMERKGYSCIPNFIAKDDLSEVQDFVEAIVEKSQHEYVVLKDRDAVQGTILDEIAGSPNFQSMFAQLFQLALGRPAPMVTFYQILRCLTGKGSASHSLIFHYDSYLITALIPVTIPKSGLRGDFLLIPNSRKVRSSYIRNLVDKILLDNRLTQALLKKRAKMGERSITRIEMIPGNLYLFWGYRSVHTNEPCDPQSVRATALFHFFDPHADSALKKRMKPGR